MTAPVSDAEFAALAAYLAAEAGLVFDLSRRPGLTSVVDQRLDATGCTSVTDYLALLAGGDAAGERQALLDRVTIQETHFFRNAAQIEALRTHVLPELLRAAAAGARPLRIWSAGCATGEEPYTLAMLALEVRDALRLDVPIRIVGTDVSAAALAVAAAATYQGRTVELAEPGAIERWFDRVGAPEPPTYRVNHDVRAVVTFAEHNLVADQVPFGPGELDLVVCRNVTIYFARETTRALVGRFHASLRPGGHLLLGHAETLWQVSDAFALVPVAEAFVYRKESAVVGSPDVAPATPRLPTTGSSIGRAVSKVTARTKVTRPAHARRAAPAPSGEDSLVAARLAWAEGRYADVVELTDRATAADPLLADAHILNGHALATLGEDARAVDPLRKAVYLEPGAGHAHFLLAGVLGRLDQPAAAARCFRAAATTLPAVSADHVRFLLDGRDVGELVALCDQLAARADDAAVAAVAAAAPTTPAGSITGRGPR